MVYICLNNGGVVEKVPSIYQSTQLSRNLTFPAVAKITIRFDASSLSNSTKFSPFAVSANLPSIFSSANVLGFARPSVTAFDLMRCTTRDICRTVGNAGFETELLILETLVATMRFVRSSDVAAVVRTSSITNLACSLRMSGACV